MSVKLREGHFESKRELSEKLVEWVKDHPHKKNWWKREKFVRILVAQKELAWRLRISQEFFGKQIGVKRDTVRVWINDFIEKGWLVHLDDFSFGENAGPKVYKAQNEILDQMLFEFNVKKRKDLRNIRHLYQLPNQIDDGCWYQDLFKYSFNFATDKTPDRFLDWVKTLPNWDKKPNRIKMALSAWKSRHLYLQKDS